MFGELCRLCERPAADGGHRAAELDKHKFQEWCLNFLGTTLAEEIDDQDLFCYFCVWDARYNNTYKGKVDPDLYWWPEKDADANAQELYKNYTAGKVQQCWVSLEKLPGEEKEGADACGKDESRLKKNCCYCGKKVVELTRHMKYNHADDAIRCNYHSQCSKYFKTEDERDAHVNEFHLKPREEIRSDCIYCAKKGIKVETLHQHVKSKHRDVAIRCSVRSCALYFKTRAELDLHFEAKHKSEEEEKKIKCSICEYKAKSMDAIENHKAKYHGIQQIIKCQNCPKILGSKFDLQYHLKRTHNFRKCPACNFKIPVCSYYKHFTKRYCKKCKAEFDCLDLHVKHETNCNYEFKCELSLKS
ncbi:zinc finger Y-chromosomal protein 2-like [Neocloeon triangulifer]|uniref:zinc finger Y-chromosomal protein 2-like n=1 Tax=Neocloeon triangulifer TaxID=2078957 RepID=UPI00286FA7A6|nr:zinc finger Y-chromosomal protein 2-like [Neocloeon triangulifer]